MSSWVALLRGINVGGKVLLPMAELRFLAEECGFADVRTYIQSGNVVFTAGCADPAPTLAAALATHTGRTINVFTRTASEMSTIVEHVPGAAWDDAARHVLFTAGPAEALVDGLDLASFAPDAAVVAGRDIHIHCPDGFGRSKLAARLSRRPEGTIRNWRTVTTLAAMAAGK